MKDAEHLAKLLAGSTPTFFKSILSERFDTNLPDIDPKAGKRSIRARFAEALSFLPVNSRRDLDDWAERVTLLTDAPGMDAVKRVRQQRFGHSTVAFTMDRYANCLPGMDQKAAAGSTACTA